MLNVEEKKNVSSQTRFIWLESFMYDKHKYLYLLYSRFQHCPTGY